MENLRREPDFEQFLRAVINRLLQPTEVAKLPAQIGPIMHNFRKDQGLKIADLVYLVGQLRGISTGAAEFRSVPSYVTSSTSPLYMDKSAEQIFKAIREGKPIGGVGTTSIYTPPSPATIVAPVIDRLELLLDYHFARQPQAVQRARRFHRLAPGGPAAFRETAVRCHHRQGRLR